MKNIILNILFAFKHIICRKLLFTIFDISNEQNIFNKNCSILYIG